LHHLEESPYSFEDLRGYPSERRGDRVSNFKRYFRLTDFDDSQPIIEGSIGDNGKSYMFLPQYCVAAFNNALQHDEDIRKKINNVTKLEDKVRFNVLKDFVRNIQFLNSEPIILSEHEIISETPSLKAYEANQNTKTLEVRSYQNTYLRHYVMDK